jgi:hypothetical protein
MALLRFGLGLGLSAVTVGVVTTVVGGSPAKAEFIYGAGLDGNLYEINIQARTTSFLAPTGFTGIGGTGIANGLANERTRNNLFFFDPNSNLRVLRQGQTTAAQVVATATQLGIPTTGIVQPQNAAFFNGDYWYFTRQSNVLNRVSFTYTGNTPVFNAIQSFTLANVPNTDVGGNINLNNFGDIAITSGGLLFAATSDSADGRFFSLNLATLNQTAINNSYTQLDASLGIGNIQIAFNPNFSTLYGINGNNGNWVTVNTTNGTTTNFSPTFVTNTPGDTRGFADLSDSATLVRIPGPLPLLGAAAAFGWSRKLRKRINSTLCSEKS